MRHGCKPRKQLGAGGGSTALVGADAAVNPKGQSLLLRAACILQRGLFSLLDWGENQSDDENLQLKIVWVPPFGGLAEAHRDVAPGLTLWLSMGPPPCVDACTVQVRQLGLDALGTLLVPAQNITALEARLLIALALPQVSLVVVDAADAIGPVKELLQKPRLLRRLAACGGSNTTLAILC